MSKDTNKTREANLRRQRGAEHDPKPGEPGYVYNDEGATIKNPGPLDEPNVSEGHPVGWRQLGDRVERDEQKDIKAFDTPSPNPGDKQGGEALTPNEPGSTSIQRTADKNESLSREDTTKKAAANAKPDPLDHDSNGKKGGSLPRSKS